MAIIARRTLTPEAQAEHDFASAALAVAGHEVTDPAARDLLDRYSMREISIEDAIAEAARSFPAS